MPHPSRSPHQSRVRPTVQPTPRAGGTSRSPHTAAPAEAPTLGATAARDRPPTRPGGATPGEAEAGRPQAGEVARRSPVLRRPEPARGPSGLHPRSEHKPRRLSRSLLKTRIGVYVNVTARLQRAGACTASVACAVLRRAPGAPHAPPHPDGHLADMDTGGRSPGTCLSSFGSPSRGLPNAAPRRVGGPQCSPGHPASSVLTRTFLSCNPLELAEGWPPRGSGERRRIKPLE